MKTNTELICATCKVTMEGNIVAFARHTSTPEVGPPMIQTTAVARYVCPGCKITVDREVFHS